MTTAKSQDKNYAGPPDSEANGNKCDTCFWMSSKTDSEWLMPYSYCMKSQAKGPIRSSRTACRLYEEDWTATPE